MNESGSCTDCLGQLCRVWILYEKGEVTAGHFTFLCLVYFCCYRMRTRMTAGMTASFSASLPSTAPVASNMV